MKNLKFQNLLGSMMYLSTCTRPDLAYAVNCLARHMHNPGINHWKGAKLVLSSLNITRDRGRTYGRKEEYQSKNQIYVYCDANYGRDETRRSRTGYITIMNGGAISWKSQLQVDYSLSSTEAEYYAASEAAKEALWFRQMMSEMGFEQERTIIYEDNTSCINLANNPVADAKTRHIDIRHHHIRDCVNRGLIPNKHSYGVM
jgi:hypothetical protein